MSLWSLVLVWCCAWQQSESRVERELWPNGALRVEREVVVAADGSLVNQGFYRAFHDNGQLAEEGKCGKGLRLGEWQEFFPDGARAARGKYVKGWREGPWRFWKADTSEDQEQTGTYHWTRVLRADASLSAEGYELDGKRQGAWSYLWPTGQVQFTGHYLRGWRVGEWVFWCQDGRPSALVLSGVYSGGERQGPLSEERLAELERVAVEQRTAPERSPPGAVPAWVFDPLLPWPADWAAPLAQALLGWSAELPAAEPPAQGLARALQRKLGRHGFHSALLGAHVPPAAETAQLLRASAALLGLLQEGAVDFEFDGLLPCASDHGLASGCVLYSAPALRREERADADQRALEAPLFAARFAAVPKGASDKRELARRAAVDAALDWLLAHQSAAGSWACRGFQEQCAAHGGAPCSGAGSADYDAGVSALALLALGADGNTIHRGARSPATRRALLWLLEQQDSDSGLLGQDMYSHALATLALAEQCACAPHPALREALERAANALLRAQNPYSGWHYEFLPDGSSDSSVSSWALLALHSARAAGAQVPAENLEAGLNWFVEMQDPATGRVGYDSPGSISARFAVENQQFPADANEAMSGAAALCWQLIGPAQRWQALVGKALELLPRKLPRWEEFGADTYAWQFEASALCLGGQSAASAAFQKALQQTLLTNQLEGPGSQGSWDPAQDTWGCAGGRVMTTAMGVLALRAPERYGLAAAESRGRGQK